jgi:hypothetical protein
MSNKSVDPAMRKANLLTNMPMKSGGAFGPHVISTFGNKKQSVPVMHLSQEG